MSEGNGDRPERGFVVVDKRGRESRDEGEDRGAREASGAREQRAAEREGGTAGAAAGTRAGEAPRELPRPDFASLVISLGTSALYHLGLMRDPQSGATGTPDLVLARQTIDIVEMLREKTRGNLDAEEEKLLQSMLTDLRMRFVEVSRSRDRAAPDRPEPGKGGG